MTDTTAEQALRKIISIIVYDDINTRPTAAAVDKIYQIAHAALTKGSP